MRKLLPFLALILMTAPLQAAQLGYQDGFYLLSNDQDFRFQFNLEIQPRWQYTADKNRPGKNSFNLQHISSFFKGHTFGPSYRYFLSVEYGGEAGKPFLDEGYVDLQFSKPFSLIVGQFAIPINLEEKISKTGLQSLDVSIVSKHFSVDRDLGIQFYGKIVEPLAYSFFLVNGDGPGKNPNKSFLIGTRLFLQAVGEESAIQGDYNFSESPSLGFGTTALYDFGSARETEEKQFFIDQGVLPNEDKLVRGDLDGMFLWQGFSLIGQWHYVYNNQFRSFDQGYMGQAGYFIVPKRFEVVTRAATVIPDFPFPALSLTGLTSEENGGNGSGSAIIEYMGGLNYYIKGHMMKIQTDYTLIRNVSGFRGQSNQILRTQLTFVF